MTEASSTPDSADQPAVPREGLKLPAFEPKSRWLRLGMETVIVGFIAALSSFYMCYLAQNRFDFFDMSAFLDAGWRVYRGQEPYVDFMYIAGPVHLYMHALSFAIFGFTRMAVLSHLAVVNAAVVAATYLIARKRLPWWMALVPTVVCGLVFYCTIGHPWYDNNAFFWLIMAVLLVDFFSPYASNRTAALVGVTAGILAVLSLMTKANVGGGAGLTLAALFLVGSRPKIAFIAYCAGCALAGLVFLVLIDVPAFVYQTLLAYSPGSRFSDTLKLAWLLVVTPYIYYVITFLVLCAIGRWRFVHEHRHVVVMTGGLLFTGLLAAWTGSMIPHAALAMLGVQLACLMRLGSHLPRQPRRNRWTFAFSVALQLWLLALAWQTLETGWSRRMLTWHWNPQNNDSTYALQVKAFRGWKCNPELGEGLDRAIRAVNERVPTEDSLLVMPYGTWIYGLTGRESFTPAPFIFQTEVLPFPGEKRDEFRQALLTNPPKWMLLHSFTEIENASIRSIIRWLDLEQWLRNDYELEWQWGKWFLVKHRPAEPESGS